MRRYNMLEREQEVEQLQKLSHAELLSWFRSHLQAGSKLRRKLAVHVVGRSHAAELTSSVDDHVNALVDLAAFRDKAQKYAGVDASLKVAT